MSQEETYTKAEDVDVASTIAHLLDYEDADGDTLENMDKPVPVSSFSLVSLF